MAVAYDHLQRIVETATPLEQRLTAIKGFAEELNWTPSYEFQGNFGVPYAEDHLVVEHGLENSAIISFLKAPHRTGDLDGRQLKNLLAISYNNLVEWHIFVSETDVRFVSNLNPDDERIYPLNRTNYIEYLSGSHFDELARGASKKRAFQACDDLFIQVVSRWKRLIKADYRDEVDNSHISALFNSLIFVRGCEDLKVQDTGASSRVLPNVLDEQVGQDVNLIEIVAAALRQCGVNEELSTFIDIDNLAPFKTFDRATASDFFRDFYRPSSGEYEFNFALMSKHALSRIYERYVALLEFDEEDDVQLGFFNATPSERVSSKTGSVYTPQFIAGFFARYLRDNMTPRAFRNLKSIDPACGSGIFLRTLLEFQCNPLAPGTTPQTMSESFNLVSGVDRDPNAYEATRLSLMLLHLVALGNLPRALDIKNDDSIKLALRQGFNLGSYGAVLANPPFIKLDHLSDQEREVYKEYLKDFSAGRIDSYTPFVKLCLDLVESGGFVCLVLPQVFLTNRNAAFLRNLISEEFDVRCLVDLTMVPVFEGVGTYNILLIIQKRIQNAIGAHFAQIVRIQGFIGPALQACLDRKNIQSPYYDVFDLPQTFFKKSEWVLLGPTELQFSERLVKLNPISSYLEVKQGFISGADDIFIIKKSLVPKGERSLFANYLPDKRILRYSIPRQTDAVVFYPYNNEGKPLSEYALKEGYPGTWAYLNQNKNKLKDRRSVLSGDTPWWRPVRPRDPKNLLRFKIVCPHLMLTARFAVDQTGKFAVSHSPFLIAKEDKEELTVLKFFCAVLNSSVCQWYLSAHAPKYSRGYKRLEVSVLKKIPVPDPSRVNPVVFKELIELIDLSIEKGASPVIDVEIDQIVCNLYGLSGEERELLFGLGDE